MDHAALWRALCLQWMTTHSVSSVSEVIMSAGTTGWFLTFRVLENAWMQLVWLSLHDFIFHGLFFSSYRLYLNLPDVARHSSTGQTVENINTGSLKLHSISHSLHFTAMPFIMVFIVIGGAWYSHTGLTQLCVDADADLSGRPVRLQRRCLCSWFWFLCFPLRGLKEQKPCLVPGLQTVTKTFCEGCYVLGMYCVVVGNVFVFSFRGSVGLTPALSCRGHTDALR